MKYKSAIFDFNGTLLFDSDFHNTAWKNLAKELLDRELSDYDMNTCIHGCPNVEAIERLAPGRFTMEEKNYFSKKKEEIYRDVCRSIPNLSLVDGSPEVMNYLKENKIPFTIASASIIENIEFFYSTFRLDQWMKLEDIIYDNGKYKDKVDMFNDALAILGTEKESCIIFEDSLSGVECAIQAGFKSIILLHQYGWEAFQHYPQIIFHSNNFVDILEFLKEQ
ncbi:HAD family hydrolase [Anaerorhabdus sp.]|uniref:HAD family hydrolase n=1 Tax=Anaerorhabdus sp. TaxID=1872524 RepID=UPI002FCC4CFF